MTRSRGLFRKDKKLTHIIDPHIASPDDRRCCFSQTREERNKWRHCHLICLFETQNKVTSRVERKFRDLCSFLFTHAQLGNSHLNDVSPLPSQKSHETVAKITGDLASAFSALNRSKNRPKPAYFYHPSWLQKYLLFRILFQEYLLHHKI